ncbi:tetratricopeptide repeat protein [Propionivibrio soli]|uniref:tetratricopeptide repeat protein n=1 Tax=Propionivibrio soli TaxID=2976531 RepID=UPI0021E937CE|nr:tetratricopeptide repeat protein [Propionivibrio soli]
MRFLVAAVVSIFLMTGAIAQQLSATDPRAWEVQANKLRAANNWSGLLEHADRWIKLLPSTAEAWNAKSEAHLQMGQPLLAEAPAKEAIRLKPDLGEAWANLAYFQATYSDLLFSYVETTRTAREAIRLKRECPVAWLALGIAEHRGRHKEAAVEALQEAIRLDPNYAPAWRQLAIQFRLLKRYDEAIGAFHHATALRPDDVRAIYGLGITYAEIGQRKRVEEIYERLTAVDPQLANQFYEDVVLHPQ